MDFCLSVTTSIVCLYQLSIGCRHRIALVVEPGALLHIAAQVLPEHPLQLGGAPHGEIESQGDHLVRTAVALQQHLQKDLGHGAGVLGDRTGLLHPGHCHVPGHVVELALVLKIDLAGTPVETNRQRRGPEDLKQKKQYRNAKASPERHQVFYPLPFKTKDWQSQYCHIEYPQAPYPSNNSFTSFSTARKVQVDLGLVLHIAKLDGLLGGFALGRELDQLTGKAEALGEVGEVALDALHGASAYLDLDG